MEFFQYFFGRGDGLRDGTGCRLLADKWLEILQQICVVRQREAVICKVPRNLSSKSCGISALLSLPINLYFSLLLDNLTKFTDACADSQSLQTPKSSLSVLNSPPVEEATAMTTICKSPSVTPGATRSTATMT